MDVTAENITLRATLEIVYSVNIHQYQLGAICKAPGTKTQK